MGIWGYIDVWGVYEHMGMYRHMGAYICMFTDVRRVYRCMGGIWTVEPTDIPQTYVHPDIPLTCLPTTPEGTGGSRLRQIFWEHENLSGLSIIRLIQLL